MKQLLTTLILVVCMPTIVLAVTVRATVDKNRMTPEDTLVLTVTIDGDKPEVDTSIIRDFNILSHRTGSSFQWINGKTIKEFKHTYTLAPLNTGRLLIPQLKVTSKGNDHYTQPISVMVANTPLSEKQTHDIFVKARAGASDPFQGQQFVYTFSLYHAVQITNASLQMPDFKGFSAKETEGEKTFRTVVRGREYKVIEKQVVLIPLQKGTIAIPPSVLVCDKVVRVNPGRRDSFDSFFSDSFFGRTKLQRKQLKTEPLSINVKPLPGNPYDVEFSGLVGSANIRADVEMWELKAGDSTTLSVIVEAKGNIMDIEEPHMEIPDGFKLYRDNPEEEINVGADGFFGKKVFRLALVAVKPGTYTVDPVKLNYFDVEKKRYEVLSSGPFELTVSPSASERELSSAFTLPETETPKRLKKKVEYTGRDILPVKEELSAVADSRRLSFPLFLMVICIPIFLSAIVKVYLVVAGRDKSISSVMADRAETSLKNAKSPGLGEEEFLLNLYRAFVSVVFSKASVSGESLTASEASKILSDAGCGGDIIEDALVLLDSIESIRYSGKKTEKSQRESLLDETNRLIRRLR